MDAAVPATPTPEPLRRYFEASRPLATCGASRCDDAVRDVWLDTAMGRLHLDLHESAAARAAVVLQPGVGSYGRFYAPLGGLLARAGYHVLALDRPGHGYSAGQRGDCDVLQALQAGEQAIAYARGRWRLPVVLAGSSLGGVLTGCALLAGQRPDAAIVHNFVLPGRLFSMRLRARIVRRWRRRPYPLAELANGWRGLSADPALLHYLRTGDDPQVAWLQSVRAVASLFAHDPPRPRMPHPPLLVLTGERDRTIPAWATRGFVRWAGLQPQAVEVLPGAGHMLFHDHLPESLPVVLAGLERLLGATGHRPTPASSAR